MPGCEPPLLNRTDPAEMPLAKRWAARTLIGFTLDGIAGFSGGRIP
jgi:hypothetical protein